MMKAIHLSEDLSLSLLKAVEEKLLGFHEFSSELCFSYLQRNMCSGSCSCNSTLGLCSGSAVDILCGWSCLSFLLVRDLAMQKI